MTQNTNHNRQKKIAVINDFSGFGRCSITVALPIISAIGIQCCPIPTAVFSNHTGFPSYQKTDFTENMRGYAAEWKRLDLHFDGIATGFLGSEEQIHIVKEFLETFTSEGTNVLVDPVMGDYGKLYPGYGKRLSERMIELLPFANVITPNLTEACILAGTDYKSNPDEAELEKICSVLHAEGPETVVISGIDGGETLGNYVSEKNGEAVTLWYEKVGTYRSGTGDVFASVLIGEIVRGMKIKDAVAKAADFIVKAMKKTTALGIPATDGLAIEECLSEFMR